MPLTAASELVTALREYQVLDAAQLEEVSRDAPQRWPDARALARELLQRGWLTGYQANQLLQGRGAELVLGPYVLLDRLGQGGMGQVFKARHRLMNRTVALKIIRQELLAKPDAVQRFQREIRMAAQLDHPHLVRAHDAAQIGAIHILVMEYADGTDLQKLVRQSGPLPISQACEYIRQAALGLQYAMERGMVHRDIKPSNLQITAQGRVVKILDMGLARTQAGEGDADSGDALTQQRMILGTPDYIAPEQISDARQVDSRADIYSLGCTLYFALTGQPPFPDGAWDEKLACHRRAEPRPLEQLRPDVPGALGLVVRRMMAKRPDDRYAAPLEVAAALAPFCVPNSAGGLPGTPEQAGAVVAPQPSTVAMPGRLSSGPANRSDWAVPANSTGGPPGTAQATPSRPPPGPTVLVAAVPPTAFTQAATPHAASPPYQAGPGRRFWLWLAAGSALIVLLVVIGFWPKGNGTSNKDDDGLVKAPLDLPKPKLPQKLLEEDFRTAYENKELLPKGWKGDAYRVAMEHSETFLELGDSMNEIRWVKTPPLLMGSHALISGVYILCPQGGPSFIGPYGQKLLFRLESSASSATSVIGIVADGHVTINDTLFKPPPSLKQANQVHQFAILRVGDKFSVRLDGIPVGEKTVPPAGEYDSVSICLTATPALSRISSRLFKLKIENLPPPKSTEQ